MGWAAPAHHYLDLFLAPWATFNPKLPLAKLAEMIPEHSGSRSARGNQSRGSSVWRQLTLALRNSKNEAANVAACEASDL
jgi:hypothetical protein